MDMRPTYPGESEGEGSFGIFCIVAMILAFVAHLISLCF
jgi:hypothetical protein